MTIPIPPGEDTPPGTLPGTDPRDVPPAPSPLPGPDPNTEPPTSPGPLPGRPILPGPQNRSGRSDPPTPARETHGVPGDAYASEVWDDELPANAGGDSHGPSDSATVTA